MTPQLPLALHYEVPDRGAPWAQGFTARLEAIARAARVPLVTDTSAADLTRSTRTVHVRLSQPWPPDSSRTPAHPPLTVTLGPLHLTPANPGSETERALALTDIAALLLDLARLSADDRHEHPLLQLPPGHYLAHIEARSELVPDLSGALTRHTLAQLATHLRALMERPAPIDTELGRRAPNPPAASDDPGQSLNALAEEHHAATRRALSELERHLEHALATHGLAAIEPLLEHLARLERQANDRPRRRSTTATGSPELELEAADQALARAHTQAQSLTPPLPRQLALVGVHAPLVAAFGAMALAPLAASIIPAEAGGPWVLAGASALGLFAIGGALANGSQHLADKRAQRRLARAERDVQLAQRHRVAETLAAHAEAIEEAATRRYLDGLEELRARLSPIARKVHALASAYPRSAPSEALVTVLAPPVEPWVQAIQDELSQTSSSGPTYHPPTLLSLEERVASAVAERARWQGRADVAASLERPAVSALAALATRLNTRLPQSAPAHRFALIPRPLSVRERPDALAPFALAPSHAGLYALGLIPLAADPEPGGSR